MEALRTENYKGYEIEVFYDDCAEDPREWENVATFACKHSRYNLGDNVDFDSELTRLFNKYVSIQTLRDHFVKSKNAGVFVNEDNDKCYKWSEKWHDGSVHTHIIRADDDEELYDWIFDDLTNMEKVELVRESDDIVLTTISIYDHSGVIIWLGTPDGHVDARWDCGIVGIAYVEKSVAEKWGALNKGHNGYDSWQDWAWNRMKSEMKIYDDYVEGNVFYYDVEGIDMCGCGGWYGSEGVEEAILEAKSEIDAHIEWKTEERKKNLSTVKDNLQFMVGCTFVEDNEVFKVVFDSDDKVEVLRGVAVHGMIKPCDFSESEPERMSDYLLKQIVSHLNKENNGN